MSRSDRRRLLPLALSAATALAGCMTPHSQPTLSRAVMDARAGKDVQADACPAVSSPQSIGFGFSSASLDDVTQAPLERTTALLTCHPTVRVVIWGDADVHGTEAEQKKLAGDRAKAVFDYLQAHGVAAARMSTQVMGTLPTGSAQLVVVKAEGRRW